LGERLPQLALGLALAEWELVPELAESGALPPSIRSVSLRLRVEQDSFPERRNWRAAAQHIR